MSLFNNGGHYCWDDDGPYWKWCLKQGGNYFADAMVRLRMRYPDHKMLELMIYGGPREKWASQRPSPDEVNRQILEKLREDGRIYEQSKDS